MSDKKVGRTFPVCVYIYISRRKLKAKDVSTVVASWARSLESSRRRRRYEGVRGEKNKRISRVSGGWGWVYMSIPVYQIGGGWRCCRCFYLSNQSISLANIFLLLFSIPLLLLLLLISHILFGFSSALLPLAPTAPGHRLARDRIINPPTTRTTQVRVHPWFTSTTLLSNHARTSSSYFLFIFFLFIFIILIST